MSGPLLLLLRRREMPRSRPAGLEALHPVTLQPPGQLPSLEAASSSQATLVLVHSSCCTAEGLPWRRALRMPRSRCRDKPVIEKALVDLGGPAMRAFSAARSSWAAGDHYRVPGPIQARTATSCSAAASVCDRCHVLRIPGRCSPLAW